MFEATHDCSVCESPVTTSRGSYRYSESGLPAVILQGAEVADCLNCGNSDVVLPHLAKIHSAIALALLMSPRRLTGPQFRFLRKHLGLTGEQFAAYLHTDKTKISKWERGEDVIGPASDRLVRLVTAALDKELLASIPLITQHLPEISDEPGDGMELHVNVEPLTWAYFVANTAA